MHRLFAFLCVLLMPLGAFAEGLDEATILPDSNSTVERLLMRAGFGDLQKSYALVVGISDFDNFADLPTQADPIRVRDYLVNEAGFDYVHILTEEKVTKARLEELMLDEFRPLVGPSDRFLFYWSGHGETLEVGAGEVGFLPLANSPLDAYSTMVAMSDLTRWNQFISAHQVLYLLDSCFSGLAGGVPQSNLASITREQLSGPGRHMITAGRVNEQTIAVDDLGGSIFTHALLKGLRGAADSRNELGADGLIAVGELKSYLGQEIGRLRDVYNWQKTITPQIRDLSGSDGAFFFPVASRFPDRVETQDDPEGGTTSMGGGGADQGDLAEIQRGLIALGYDPGAAGGVLNFATRRALIAFQTDNALPRTGEPDEQTVVALIIALAPPLDDPDPVVADDVTPPVADEWGIDMVQIAGGIFTMGRDNGRPEQGPARAVEVAPFQVAATETTIDLFARYIADEGLDFISRKVEPDPSCYDWNADNRLRRTAYAYNQLSNTPDDFPVSCVNREDIDGFLDWLNADVDGPPYRLLNEAEFEYLLVNSRPDTLMPVCERANVADTSASFTWRHDICDDGAAGVSAVARYKADPSGLYDLQGNLWEWVSDCWRATHDAPVPTGACETGIVRGASFDDPLDNLHPTIRQPVPVKRRQTNIGFRLARDAG